MNASATLAMIKRARVQLQQHPKDCAINTQVARTAACRAAHVHAARTQNHILSFLKTNKTNMWIMDTYILFSCNNTVCTWSPDSEIANCLIVKTLGRYHQ